MSLGYEFFGLVFWLLHLRVCFLMEIKHHNCHVRIRITSKIPSLQHSVLQIKSMGISCCNSFHMKHKYVVYNSGFDRINGVTVVAHLCSRDSHMAKFLCLYFKEVSG